jgi:thioredoxin reductase (NADPH)
MENVVIIGSGCAGWTAALYTARANLKPLLITGEQPGGLLTTTSIVENFPGWPEGIDGYELMTKMQAQAERFRHTREVRQHGASVDFSNARSRSQLWTEKVEAKTVIIATGAGHRHLGLESEHLLDKKGVTYCATCDGALPMFRNQPLVVVGGGDSACEEAMYLTRFASVVYLIHRRDTLRASKIMADRTLANPKIKMVWDSVVTEILDVKQDKVTGVRVKNLKTTLRARWIAPACSWPSVTCRTRKSSSRSSTRTRTVTSSAPKARRPMCPACSSRAIARITSIVRPSRRQAWVARRPLKRNASSPRKTLVHSGLFGGRERLREPARQHPRPTNCPPRIALRLVPH